MSQIMRAVKNTVKALFSPMPSLFDLFVCLGIVPIGFINKTFQGHYLVFYTIFLFIISFMYKCQRNYKNVWFTLILLWSFYSIFVHSYLVNVNSVMFKYLNFYLMSEGFLYILFGIIYLYLITVKAKNLRLLWITLPIALIPLFRMQLHCGQMSYILALVLSVIIYNIRKQYWTLAFIALSGVIVIAILNLSWLVMKFNCRPYIWWHMIKGIMDYPFVGTGFNRLLQPDNMTWVTQIGKLEYGWLWRHNDYLSLAGYIGLPILIPIIGLIKSFHDKFRDSWKIIVFTSFVIVCFFQMTMFDPYKAFIILTILGYLHIEEYHGV